MGRWARRCKKTREHNATSAIENLTRHPPNGLNLGHVERVVDKVSYNNAMNKSTMCLHHTSLTNQCQSSYLRCKKTREHKATSAIEILTRHPPNGLNLGHVERVVDKVSHDNAMNKSTRYLRRHTSLTNQCQSSYLDNQSIIVYHIYQSSYLYLAETTQQPQISPRSFA